jgi:hypothetical protein
MAFFHFITNQRAQESGPSKSARFPKEDILSLTSP